MKKFIFDTALVSSLRAMNRAPLKEPGIIRVAAKEEERTAELFIYGDIGGWWDDSVSADAVARELSTLDVDEINVRMNSGGGLVFEGIAIYNSLAQHKARVIVNIDGIAASIASVIAMAGDEIRISEGANIMIHKPWSGVIGDAGDMRKEADVLDKLEVGIIDLYEARTGLERSDIEQMVADETWLLGQEAVDAGFADTLIPAKSRKVAKSSMMAMYRHAPANIVAAPEGPAIRELEKRLRDGEGLSNAQAKRIASLAHRELAPQAPQEPTQTLRDEGGEVVDELKKFTAHIRSILK